MHVQYAFASLRCLTWMCICTYVHVYIRLAHLHVRWPHAGEFEGAPPRLTGNAAVLNNRKVELANDCEIVPVAELLQRAHMKCLMPPRPFLVYLPVVQRAHDWRLAINKVPSRLTVRSHTCIIRIGCFQSPREFI